MGIKVHIKNEVSFMTDFFEVIRKRRSVRKFTDQKVDPQKMMIAFEAAILAPNSSNMQPWEFYWIQNLEKKQKCIKACFNQNAAKTAQELVFVVARIDKWKTRRQQILNWIQTLQNPPKILRDYYEKLIPLAYWRDPFFIKDLISVIFTTAVGFFRPIPRAHFGVSAQFEGATKSTALACENLMLALTAQGLASCPMEGFDEVRIKKILKLNRFSHIVMGIGIGHASAEGIYTEQFRLPLSDVLFKV
jgi:nitroreductase